MLWDSLAEEEEVLLKGSWRKTTRTKVQEIHIVRRTVYLQFAIHSRQLSIELINFEKKTLDFGNALAAGDFPPHLTNAFALPLLSSINRAHVNSGYSLASMMPCGYITSSVDKADEAEKLVELFATNAIVGGPGRWSAPNKRTSR